MSAYRIRASDRWWFSRCRRAWDFRAAGRQNYEPVPPRVPGVAAEIVLQRAIQDALAVYYFPGMWDWDRSIVRPLVLQAWAKAGGTDASVLENYFSWAPTVDRFTPLQVSSDVEVAIPDPFAEGRDLGTEQGERVYYVDRIDLLAVDEEEQLWMVQHRVVDGDWPDEDLLRLDDRSVLWCWAWELYTLSPTPVTGVVHNLFAPDGSFKRIPVALDRAELTSAGLRVGIEAIEMLDAGLRVYPAPAPDICVSCPFRAPCVAMNRGEDPIPLLDTGFRKRPDDALEEGRLGGSSWGLGRGAAPPRFGRGDQPGG